MALGRSYLRTGTRQYCRTDHLEDHLEDWLHWRWTEAFGRLILEEPGGRCRRKLLTLLVVVGLTVLAGGGSSGGDLRSISQAQRKAEHRC